MTKAAPPAPVDCRTPEQRAEDKELVGRSWRCRVHGRRDFDAALWVGEHAYCSQGDCTEELLGVGKAMGAVDPTMSAWSKDYRPAKAKRRAPAPVDQVVDEEPEAGPPADVPEVSETLASEGDGGLPGPEAAEVVHPPADPAPVSTPPDEGSDSKEVEMSKSPPPAFKRGELQDAILKTLSCAPERKLEKHQLAGIVWPTAEDRVRMNRLSMALKPAVRRGFVKIDGDVVSLLIKAPRPSALDTPARAAAPRARAMARSGAPERGETMLERIDTRIAQLQEARQLLLDAHARAQLAEANALKLLEAAVA